MVAGHSHHGHRLRRRHQSIRRLAHQRRTRHAATHRSRTHPPQRRHRCGRTLHHFEHPSWQVDGQCRQTGVHYHPRWCQTTLGFRQNHHPRPRRQLQPEHGSYTAWRDQRTRPHRGSRARHRLASLRVSGILHDINKDFPGYRDTVALDADGKSVSPASVAPFLMDSTPSDFPLAGTSKMLPLPASATSSASAVT